MSKRLFSFFLCLVMVLSVLPASALAEEEESIAETLVQEDQPAKEEVIIEEEPVDEVIPAAEEEPIIEEEPIAEEVPVVEETPAAEEAPVVEETPAAEEEPAIVDVPAAEEKPDTEDQPTQTMTVIAEASGELTAGGLDIYLDDMAYSWYAPVYTGNPIKPKVTIYQDGTLLSGKKDYTVTYANNVKVAKATYSNAPTVTIEGKGNYSGKVVLKFPIQPDDIKFKNDYRVEAKYTGSSQLPKPVICSVSTGKTLKLGEDYKVFCKDANNKAPKACDDYIFTVVGIGSYRGELDGCFTITAHPITSCTVKLNKTKVVYRGEDTEHPRVTVMDGKKKLVEEVDYYLGYNNDTDPGTATIEVIGMGKYKSVLPKVVRYKVLPKPLSLDMVLKLNPSMVYDGWDDWGGWKITEGIDFRLYDSHYRLVDGVDFTYSVPESANLIDVGTIPVTVKGIGAYSGKLKLKFTIKRHNLSEAEFLMDECVPYQKGGARPIPTVIVDGHYLKYGKDFTVTYTNNAKLASASSKDAPSLYITGKGNYSGSTKSHPIKFTIVKNDFGDRDVSYKEERAKYLNGEAGDFILKPILRDSSNRKLEEGKDYTIVGYYTDDDMPLDPRKPLKQSGFSGYQLYAKCRGIGRYSGEINCYYYVYSKKISDCTILFDDWENGRMVTKYSELYSAAYPCEPAVFVFDKDGTELNYNQFITSYSNNHKVGTATVTVTGIPGNGYGGTAKVTFTIMKYGMR